jgi:REP element-mobilizing transposase RayT
MNRRTKLRTGETYHLYNRGNRKAEVFHDRQDYLYFLRQLRKYLLEFPVTLIAYCLMPNHYYLMVRQDGDNAISEMMQALGTSLSKTYNEKYGTVGSLFQGKFRDEHVGDNGYLMFLARYIHRNPIKAKLCAAPEDWEFSNYRDVLGQRAGTLCDFSSVLACFADDANIYREFVLDPLADEWEPRLMKKIRRRSKGTK